MADTITQDEVVTEKATEQTNEAAAKSTQLQAAFWEDKPLPTQQEEKKIVPTITEEKKDEPQVQANEWWKNFGWENEDAAKAEIPKLKEAKPQEELKFANDDSKKVFDYLKEGKVKEVVDLYQTQNTVSRLLDGDIDEKKAAEIIKFNLSTKKDFTESDVERKFNRQYAIPKEPVYDELKETEDEFKEKHEAWKEKVSEIKADMILDAKELKPTLEKIKSELVLPDIPINSNANNERQPTPEELAADRKLKDDWTKSATEFATKFDGFSTVATYKENGKDVEIPVNYGLSTDEKKIVNENVSKFVESGFNAMSVLKDRWVDKDGNDKIDQVVKDLSWLLFGEKAAQKFANEAHEQRMETYLKGKKNINVDGSGGKNFGEGEFKKTQSEQLQEVFWNS